MEINERERSTALTAPVSVIYVNIDDPVSPRQCRRAGGRGFLQEATSCLNQLTDYVDAMRRSIERFSK